MTGELVQRVSKQWKGSRRASEEEHIDRALGGDDELSGCHGDGGV